MSENKKVTLKEATKILDLSPVWVRRMAKQGDLGELTRDPAGRILLPAGAVNAKRAELEAKYEKARNRQSNYIPPSLKAVDIIKRAVENDGELKAKEKAHFLERLAAYRAFYEERLESIRAGRA